MHFSLVFHTDALADWQRLDNGVKNAFKKKLEKRLVSPVVPADRLSGKLSDCFKIKNRSSGHRLIYTVLEKTSVVFVLAIGKREDFDAYERAKTRI